MRILVINYEYPPVGGGGGFVTRDILEQVVKCGHSVSIITSSFQSLERHEIVNGVEVFRVPVLYRKKMEVATLPSMLSYFPSSVFNAPFLLNGRKYDIINTHFAIPCGPVGYILSKLYRVPNILSLHGGDIFDPSKSLSPHNTPVLSTTVQTMINRADRVVAQSSDTKANAYRYYKIKREIDIIPLGIKQPVFKRKNRQEFGLDSDEIVFVTVGRLIKRKNLDDVIDALAKIKNRYRFKFLIMGEGPERAHLEGLIKQFRLEGMVRLLGNVSDEVKFQLLHLSDCYLSTALHEGFGLVFLESMECGLPIICYNRGGQNDFLINKKTGFLVELGDKNAFHDRIIELIQNKNMKGEISYYNKNLVKKYYISNCAERYISTFQEVISEFHTYKNNQFEKKLENAKVVWKKTKA
jgi:glycosyltransferase involved in cell wall biosynthesis